MQLMSGLTGDNYQKTLMPQINYKVPGGKMLRLKLELDGHLIKSIQISGDFFIHPEPAISDIEKFLENKDVREVGKQLSFFINQHQIKLIGFSPTDLQECLLESVVN